MKRLSVLILAVMLCTLFIMSAKAEFIGDEIILDMGPMFGVTEEDAPTFKGDVNGDGYVTSVDVTVLATALATGAEDLSDAANVYDDDDVINIKDLIALMQIVYQIENGTEQTERIVAYSGVAKDEDNLCRNYYDVFNPYTSNKVGNIAGNRYSEEAKDVPEALTAGTVATFTDGKLDEASASKVITPETDFMWIIGYDTEKCTITLLPENSTDENDAITYVYTENTALSKLEYMIKTEIFKWGAMSSLDAETLHRHINSNDYKCYNNKILAGDTFQTKYAKYIKAFVSPIENTNVLDYAIVIVHGDEAEANLNM